MWLFEPWVGQSYDADGFFGRRVLILGESHYGTPEQETASFTRECVESLAKAASGHRFFTVVAKLLLGAPPGVSLSRDQRTWFWDRVAFYNYIQAFPSHTSRVRPTGEMWSAAAQCFPALLQRLRPDFMLVLGRELAERIPRIPPPTTVCAIPHPSSFGFQQTLWSKNVQVALHSPPVAGA
jgi:hypothetical protein